jgi:integrase
MGGSTWVQDKTELYEGELAVFKRPNSPNWYMRVWIASEKKHFSQSLRTKSHFEAIERAKVKYKELQLKIAREEKVFTITLGEAYEQYEKDLILKQRRGMIGNDWFKKQSQYIRNTFIGYYGASKSVNDISDKQISEYIDIRLQQCKRKQTIVQEITIIKLFYKDCLIKGGYISSLPNFPKFRIKQSERSRRTDTFTNQEMEKLFRFMIEKWCFRSTSEKYVTEPRVRYAVKEYGKKENNVKNLNDWEWDMELHRRHLMLYALLLLALTGMRAPSEIFNLTWGDIVFKRKRFDNRNLVSQPMNILPMGEMIDLSLKNTTILTIHKIFQEWCENDQREVDISVISIKNGKTGDRQIPCMLAGLFHQIEDYYHFMDVIPPFSAEQPIFLELFGRRKGKTFDKYAFNRMFRELMERVGLNRIKFTPYHFRHYFITERIRAGTPVPQLSKLVGNSPQEIYRTYEHLILEDDIEMLFRTT